MIDTPTSATGGRRLGVAVLGGAVVVVGVALLVLPGPGLLVLGAGLSILGREYDWAARLQRRIKARLFPPARTTDHDEPPRDASSRVVVGGEFGSQDLAA